MFISINLPIVILINYFPEHKVMSLNALFCLINDPKPQKYLIYYNVKQEKAAHSHTWEFGAVMFFFVFTA